MAGGDISGPTRNSVMSALRQHFRPEYLNRVDDIVIFKPLTMPQLKRIVELQVEDVRRRLRERNITLELTDPAKELVAEAGFDPVYGARPLKRYIQHELETRIGRSILSGEINDGARVKVDAVDSHLAVSVENPEPAEAVA
jgi:ATP-dependent Clp protease ATP-binding subunit ClpB